MPRKFRSAIRILFLTTSMLILASCTPIEDQDEQAADLNQRFGELVTDFDLATLGAGIIEDGQLVWTGYFGERVPGEPANAGTMFNVGSVTKTVTAEVAVQMAALGGISLDESMSEYWIDPDLIEDPRHEVLTPSHALSHRTGFLNWRYMDSEFKLRFVNEPGEKYGYSGEGMDYLARFLENKSGKSFEVLVNEYVLQPLSLQRTSITRQPWVIENLVTPVDVAGSRHEPYCAGPDARYCLDNGEWSAADELATTVEDYAAFMIAIMNGAGLSDSEQQARLNVVTSTADDAVLSCKLANAKDCPLVQGYGLGWEIFEFDDAKYVSHGGSDWSERAMVYFDPKSRNGIILFINGSSETSVDALIEGMKLLDPESKMATMYQGWVDAWRAQNSE